MAFGKSTRPTHETAPVVVQHTATIGTGPHHGRRIHRFNLHVMFDDLRNSIRAGKNHSSILPDGRRTSDTGELLGYEAIYTGDATVTEIGDPSTVDLTFTNREVQVGDRLLEV